MAPLPCRAPQDHSRMLHLEEMSIQPAPTSAPRRVPLLDLASARGRAPLLDETSTRSVSPGPHRSTYRVRVLLGTTRRVPVPAGGSSVSALRRTSPEERRTTSALRARAPDPTPDGRLA